jgi:hypothetical protein
VHDACPPDALLPSDAECRLSIDESCDPTEFCTGSQVACPPDTIVCADVCGNGVLEDGEDCDEGIANGAGSCCTTACRFRSAGATCRASAGPCDLAETCSGDSAACPADLKSGAVCRAATGACDVAESCDGVHDDCPRDALAVAQVVCRSAAGACDVEERCTGTSPACPADAKSTALCRGAAGVCDVAERCDGVHDACPADAKAPAGTECRVAAGDCDVAETCDGSAAACPADAFRPASTECRPATDACDAAEHCSGSVPACPADAGRTGFEAVTCAFERPLATDACAGQPVSPTIAKTVTKAGGMVTKATSVSSAARTKLLVKGGAQLRRALKLVDAAARKKKRAISGACADALRTFLNDAVRRVDGARTSTLP